MSMRPTSRSEGPGATCSGRSTSSARSSTCTSRLAGTPMRRGCSSPRRLAVPGSTSRSPPTYRLYPRVLDEMLPAAFHETEVHANNPIEADHGRLKARLRPMRGLKRDRTARVIVAGHAFIQNLRRGCYDLGTEAPLTSRLAD